MIKSKRAAGCKQWKAVTYNLRIDLWAPSAPDPLTALRTVLNECKLIDLILLYCFVRFTCCASTSDKTDRFESRGPSWEGASPPLHWSSFGGWKWTTQLLAATCIRQTSEEEILLTSSKPNVWQKTIRVVFGLLNIPKTLLEGQNGVTRCSITNSTSALINNIFKLPIA